VIGSATLVLLIAAIRSRSDKTCRGIEIEVNGMRKGKWLLDRNDIINQLTSNGTEKIKGRVLQTFDLRRLEEKLEKHIWIKDAELFFDNNETLQVRLIERTPMARIFTTSGNSFYMDDEAKRLPLSDRLTLKLPVFTGYPYEKNSRIVDTTLVPGIINMSRFINADSFWTAQIAQIDITPAHNFELVPTVGNHIIEFGDGNKAAIKFNKLMTFYRQVISKAGINKYARINVQYDQQVIGIKKAITISKADSIQAVKNIREMIELTQKMQQAVADSSIVVNPQNPIADTANPGEANNLIIRENQTVKPTPKAKLPARN